MEVSRLVETARCVAREHILVAMLGVPTLLRHPVWHTPDPDLGGGQGVVLVPGFGAADVSLALTGKWLAARGFRPAPARIGLDIGCTSTLVERIERRLEAHAEATGRKVVLLGHSRGGALARLAAARRPDLVQGLVMLASPVLDLLGARLGVIPMARMLTRLSALGFAGLIDDDCFHGDCYTVNTRALRAELPPSVPAVAFYSRHDAIAPWRLCLDPYATCVEVGSTHTGMPFDPHVYAALAPTLAAWATREVMAA
ncbi:triacylglycerol lipase [Kutzneria buriramensis]|uniref:Alpha/beta hydrolase family protein n=1 Tax=Kutzneria buriramensis TaxID=1045776 RepID=A0A3E0H838_9PSEU|nr:alpha/beta fold hydrolase [Kutzneria buriramensis]REH39294.1 alpha/beta hydrolase family protein [Kutzneria buriramensis]